MGGADEGRDPGKGDMTEATCMLCPATTPWPVGGSWAFPWVATPRGGFVARVCPGCATGSYLERLRGVLEAREAAETGARKGKRR